MNRSEYTANLDLARTYQGDAEMDRWIAYNRRSAAILAQAKKAKRKAHWWEGWFKW